MGVGRADGVALVAALLLMLMMSALGVAFSLVSSSETLIAANFRNAQAALYAADAAAERAVADLGAFADWTPLVNGTARGTFVDGAPSGARTLPDGTTIDLAQLVSLANCHKSTPCSSADMDSVTAERPWGANNPRWQLFSYGRLRDVHPPASLDSPFYIVVLVGDDGSETDGNPLHDSQSPAPGAGVIVLRAEAFGPRGVRRTMQATLARTTVGRVRVLSWREWR